MASENTKKDGEKKTVKKTTEGKSVPKKKSTSSKVGAKKTTTTKKTTTSKTATTKKEPVKKTISTQEKKEHLKDVKKSTLKKEDRSSLKDIDKNITPEKKVVVKEKVKSLEMDIVEEKEESIKTASVSSKQKIEVKKEIHESFSVYLFLLSTVLICLQVMGRFHFNLGDITLDYSVLLFSTVYFITNVITKKFDFKKAIFAILVSSMAMLIFVYFSKYLNTKVVDYFVVYGQTFAYIISQLLNLIIYYYLLVNTELKARWIFLTSMFSLAAYYFIAILFFNRIVITDTFWPTFFSSFILSGILAVMYAFYDSLVKRGCE